MALTRNPIAWLIGLFALLDRRVGDALHGARNQAGDRPAPRQARTDRQRLRPTRAVRRRPTRGWSPRSRSLKTSCSSTSASSTSTCQQQTVLSTDQLRCLSSTPLRASASSIRSGCTRRSGLRRTSRTRLPASSRRGCGTSSDGSRSPRCSVARADDADGRHPATALTGRRRSTASQIMDVRIKRADLPTGARRSRRRVYPDAARHGRSRR